MSKPKKKGVIYARYSPGPNQTEQSIEGQVRDCTQYAKENGIDIIEVYADRSMTGTECEHRDEFQRMLRDAERKQFSVVVVWKIDRFGRNRQEIAINKVHLKKNGVTVAYAKEHIPEGPEGIILESMLEGMAEYYSAELAQKIRRGQRDSVMKGRILTVRPLFGYTKDDNLHYVIDEDKAPIVLEIFQKYLDGVMLKDIVQSLTDRGIYNVNGNPFTHNSIHNMLRNRCYIGEYKFGSHVNNDAIPPIVPLDIFESAQKLLDERTLNRYCNSARAKASSNIPFLLSGLAVCGCCGYQFQGDSGKGRNGIVHHYYRCKGKKLKKTDCDVKAFRKEDLENYVFEQTVNTVLKPSMIDDIAELVVQEKNNDSSAFVIRSLEKQMSDCNTKLNNIMKAIEAGIFTDTTKDRLEELEGQKRTLEISLAKEKSKRAEITKDHVVFWLQLFVQKNLESKALSEKIFSLFVNRVIVDNDSIFVAYNLLGKEKPVDFSSVEAVRLRGGLVDLSTTYPNRHVIDNIILFQFKREA